MEPHLIEELAGVMARTAIVELQFSKGGVRVRLQRGSASEQDVAAAARQGRNAPEVLQTSPPPSVSSSPLHAVVAGMSGTFYGGPAPGDAPFVKVGDNVQEGQVLAIIEAMKMLNQIEAEISGRIVRINHQDGATVTPATVLFEIEPQGDRP